MSYISRWSTILLFATFSKTLLTTGKRLTGQYFLYVDLSTILLNTGTTDETFQQSGKQDSFRRLLTNSAMMLKSSSSEFFRTTTGIQSRPDAFHKSRFVITFPTILGVIETSCSPRLAPGEKTGNNILSHQFIETFSANSFALTDAGDNTFRPLNRGSIIADLSLLEHYWQFVKTPASQVSRKWRTL